MKYGRFFIGMTIVLVVSGAAFSKEMIEGCYPIDREDANTFNPPSFKEYRVAENFKGKPARVRLDTNDSRHYRTMLKEEAAYGPDFAGHYKVAKWGCGSSCTSWAIIDSKTGKVFFPSIDIRYISRVHDADLSGFAYNKASDLLVIVGDPDNDEKGDKEGIYYYRWKNRQLELLKFIRSQKHYCGPKKKRKTP